jgi:phosphatidylglycerol:prolipoprotein diacylglycerol transferase
MIHVARLITDPSHPSQFYQLIVSGIILLSVLLFIKRRTQKVGVLSASFLCGYGLSRILMEFFRQQDAQRSEGIFQAISMGQFLSIAMIAAGIGIFLYIKKKPIQL